MKGFRHPVHTKQAGCHCLSNAVNTCPVNFPLHDAQTPIILSTQLLQYGLSSLIKKLPPPELVEKGVPQPAHLKQSGCQVLSNAVKILVDTSFPHPAHVPPSTDEDEDDLVSDLG